MDDASGRPSWRDNDGVAALRRVSDALDDMAAAAPGRSAPGEQVTAARVAELPLQNIPAHVRFAQFWERHGSTFLARRCRRVCPLCATPPGAAWFDTQDGYQYVVCPACELIYIPEFLPLPGWNEYFDTVPEARELLQEQLEASVSPEGLARDRVRFGRYFATLRDHGARLTGARLLDIGSFTGAALRIAAEHNIVACGVEGLAEAVRFCRARFPDLRIEHVEAEGVEPGLVGGPFDLISFWETLEHTADPIRSLRSAAAMLKPGGWMVLTVPNARNVQFSVLREFCFFAYGGYSGIGHVNMFSPSSLRRVLGLVGLEPVHISSEFGTDWRQLVHYLQQRFDRIHCYRNLVACGEAADPGDADLEVLLNWVSPGLTRLENAWVAGPIMLALARKPCAGSAA